MSQQTTSRDGSSRLTVAKFGGTSMGSPEALRNASRILAEDRSSRLVVVSATSGTTNALLALAEAELAGDRHSATVIATRIRERHDDLSKQLGLVVAAFPVIFRELEEARSSLADAFASGQRSSPRLIDQLLGVGERLSSELFAAMLRTEGRGAACFDARLVLRTDSLYGRAEPELRAIEALAREHLLPALAENEVVITQGFIGATASGQPTTLGRGGSDYSAALFGEALRASAVHIWTDVPGVFTMDPSVLPEARTIPELTFAEAAELASFGAKVLHPATLLPAARSAVPVFVGSTFRSGEGGTWIRATGGDEPLVRAIALRKGQTLLTVTSLRMLNAQGFLARMFQVLAEHNLSVDVVTTSEVSVSLTVDNHAQGSSGRPVSENKALLDELRSFSELGVEEGLTLVALVGNRFTTTPGIASRALRAAEPANLRLLCHGASPHNFCFLVKSADANGVASRLHAEFLASREEGV